jgi:hypothetical protein
MALIKCAECGKEISDKAVACPNCGAPVAQQMHQAPVAKATTFKNPRTGDQVSIENAALWTFLFGPLYFAHRGIWSHAGISFVVAIVTSGIGWLVYPFFARGIIRKHLLAQSWTAVK